MAHFQIKIPAIFHIGNKHTHRQRTKRHPDKQSIYIDINEEQANL